MCVRDVNEDSEVPSSRITFHLLSFRPELNQAFSCPISSITGVLNEFSILKFEEGRKEGMKGGGTEGRREGRRGETQEGEGGWLGQRC